MLGGILYFKLKFITSKSLNFTFEEKTMRYILVLFIALGFSKLIAQNLPLGYISHFQCDFSTPQYDTNLIFSVLSESKIENGVLILKEQSDSINTFTPSAAMIIDNNIFGDFISEITLTGKQILADSSAGIFIICGLRNNFNYYLLKLNNQGIFFYKMYKGELSMISNDSSFLLKTGKPLKMRIEREILGRSISIKAQGKTSVFTDPNLVMGYFGVGVEDSKLFIDKIIVWAPTSLAEKAPLFNSVSE
jgi:hypothetical protein